MSTNYLVNELWRNWWSCFHVTRRSWGQAMEIASFRNTGKAAYNRPLWFGLSRDPTHSGSFVKTGLPSNTIKCMYKLHWSSTYQPFLLSTGSWYKFCNFCYKLPFFTCSQLLQNQLKGWKETKIDFIISNEGLEQQISTSNFSSRVVSCWSLIDCDFSSISLNFEIYVFKVLKKLRRTLDVIWISWYLLVWYWWWRKISRVRFTKVRISERKFSMLMYLLFLSHKSIYLHLKFLNITLQTVEYGINISGNLFNKLH